METADQIKVTCGGCGKSYKWKPELAGKKVKCKCGTVMAMPAGAEGNAAPAAPSRAPQAARPSAAAASAAPAKSKAKAPPARAPEPKAGDDAGLDDLYALAADEKKSAREQSAESVGLRCPSCRSDMVPGAVICTACGYNIKTGGRGAPAAAAGRAPVMAAPAGVALAGAGGVAIAGAAGPASPLIGYGTRRSTGDTAADHIGGDAKTEIYLPAGLIVLGLGTVVYQYMAGGVSLAEAMPRIGLGLLFNLVLSITACAVIGQLFELSWGAPLPALLKLVACCLMPPAIGSIVGELLGSDSGFVRVMTSSILMIPLTFGFIWWLFDFEWDEAMYCVLGIWVVNQWVVTILLGMILGGGLGGGYSGGMTANEGDRGQDQDIQQIIELGWAHEAKAWIDESPGRIVGDKGRGESVEIIQTMYDAGAKEVLVTKDGSMANKVIVPVSGRGAARKKLFDAAAQLSQKFGVTPQEDTGQKYIVFWF